MGACTSLPSCVLIVRGLLIQGGREEARVEGFGSFAHMLVDRLFVSLPSWFLHVQLKLA